MSDQYLLPCSCGQKVRIGRAQAGQNVTCACGTNLAVPTLRGLRELEPAAAEGPRTAERSWSRLHGVLFASGLVAAVLGGVLAAYNVWMYFAVQDYTVDQSHEVIAHESLHIDTGSPEELLALWIQERTHGLGIKGTPLWVAAQESAAIYRIRATIGGIVIVIGLGLALGAVLIGRSRRAA